MKKYIKEFCKRGLMWGAWGGPVILAIVWLCLQAAGVVTSLTVNEAVLGILTTAVMGFIAAGVSVVYTIETLPKAFAALIQCSVLYIDYLGIYLLNGWLPTNKIWIFTVVFVLGFAVVWLGIYFSIKARVHKMNQNIKENNK